MRLTLLFLLVWNLSFSQKFAKISELDSALSEISGLSFLNDTTLVAHNDSGNEPLLFLLNLRGEIIKTIHVSGVKNRDWEDLTTDRKNYLYLADFGNNNNRKKKFQIYRFSFQDLLTKDSIRPDEITYSYPDQHAFPPADSALHYDAEALAFYRDSLYVFTKCRTVPFDGLSFVYRIGAEPGEQIPVQLPPIFLGKRGFWKDAVTAGEILGDTLYLLTYNRFLAYRIVGNRVEFLYEHITGRLTQKEALALRRHGEIWIADEQHRLLGGGNIYLWKRKRK